MKHIVSYYAQQILLLCITYVWQSSYKFKYLKLVWFWAFTKIVTTMWQCLKATIRLLVACLMPGIFFLLFCMVWFSLLLRGNSFLPCSSMSSSPSHTSIHILPHLLCFTWCHLLLSLQLSMWLLDSASTVQLCTSVAGSRHPWFSSQEMVTKVGGAEFDPCWDWTPELQDCSLAL